MAENTIAEFFSLLGISICIILFRLFCRISLLGIRQLQLDDYLMALAGVSSILQFCLVLNTGLIEGILVSIFH